MVNSNNSKQITMSTKHKLCSHVERPFVFFISTFSLMLCEEIK